MADIYHHGKNIISIFAKIPQDLSLSLSALTWIWIWKFDDALSNVLYNKWTNVYKDNCERSAKTIWNCHPYMDC